MATTKGKTTIAAEADSHLLAQIEAVLAKLRSEHPGVSFTRSDAIRSLLVAGLAATKSK